ncbi:MAG: DUF475 domain-containing protein [Alphaproteobacteria bacterium]|uniref:DUF475 domain-containing protein n=1 Tax=Celeribacter baekdonensis TaxID=875171 RepID=A0A1G7JWM2_9RHOB|nr:DUF475 domain-containing protein [Celeribacter baekdonensis]MBU0642796.1 DUF475 domain-containing protein [Alphaproteobacteria bacterium]MBU1278659.1 DUF475 domain-containing protein [Alphaproteobacteria bacterium]MBU1573912.1 DUF475 domain-containing protein [Alphaproteobacteria bacterium]MBU1829404.1 DUF475 domain-containing protein [Alphaproteobacteria bacterium]MBU2079539.1 DUF475 domain-containing protein [Alphaproteobacteria bacterium]
MSSSIFKYFRWSFAVTLIGLGLCIWLGWAYTGQLSGMIAFVTIGIILSVLEISLSFDNAIVNANKLRDMSDVWRRRFLTWGILIAVFGMRIIFPLAVVSIAAKIGPIEAIRLAATEPSEYARLIGAAHLSISAFGGTFLMMVALNYFIDPDKEVDWLRPLENLLRTWASVRGVAIGLVLLIVLLISGFLDQAERGSFLVAAIAGLVAFIAVETLGHILDRGAMAAAGGFGAFMYLEVLDASFSFDGVIGAFALTQNLFLIAIGLGIGAMYVRSMTIMLVEKETLTAFRYLEHGAFYSVFVLSCVMFVQSLVHIPEVITGLVGAGFILLSLVSSLRYNKRRSHPAAAE